MVVTTNIAWQLLGVARQQNFLLYPTNAGNKIKNIKTVQTCLMAQAIDKSHFALEIARELVCRNTASYIYVTVCFVQCSQARDQPFTFASHHFEYYSDIIIGHLIAKVSVRLMRDFFPPNLDNVLSRKLFSTCALIYYT